MSSSISSSEAGAAWRQFAVTLLGAAAAALVGIVGLAYAVDPYDSGRSALFAKPGVRPQGPRTAAASRGRDQTFDSAVIGNSHVQLLSPARLKEKTGLAFVQLSVPASRPKEHLVLLDWFLRHRRTPPRAVILGVDTTWCTQDPKLTNDKPFPFWLFSANPLAYARGLIRYDILEELPRRLAYVFGRSPERARPDGYWDYEADYMQLGYDRRPDLRARLEVEAGDWATDPRGFFPAANALREAATMLPAQTALIILFPPSYVRSQPKPGTPAAAADEACKARFREIAASRPRTAVVDWRSGRAPNRDPVLFFDQTHYRQPIAELVENDVAKSLAGSP